MNILSSRTGLLDELFRDFSSPGFFLTSFPPSRLRRVLPIREWIRWTRALAFFQLWLNFTLRLIA